MDIPVYNYAASASAKNLVELKVINLAGSDYGWRSRLMKRHAPDAIVIG